MNSFYSQLVSLLALLIVSASSPLQAASVQVSALGEHGWISGDTRASGYADVHGDIQLVSARSAGEDTLIAARLEFTLAPATPPVDNGALRLSTYASDDKATLEKGDLGHIFTNDIIIEYAWYSNTATTVAAPAIKLGIDTSETNGVGDLASDRGENMLDKILVYEPYLNAPVLDSTWKTEFIAPTEGLWWLVNLDPNASSSLPGTDANNLKTLDEWASMFNSAGLTNSTIASLQIGVGSGNSAQESYVDYLSFSTQGDTDLWDFAAAPIPLPPAIALYVSALGLLGARPSIRKVTTKIIKTYT